MEEVTNDQVVPFQGKAVTVRRCGPADLLVLTDWCDLYLAGDFHFKRRHMHGILTRGTSDVWAILVDGVFAGLLILYRGSTLHNLYLSPENRSGGIGSAIIEHFKPAVIRAKRNMQAGDPVPFYEANGYEVKGAAEGKEHIAIMHRSDSAAEVTILPRDNPADEPIDWMERKRLQNRERSRRRRERLRNSGYGADHLETPATGHVEKNGHATAPVFTFTG